jgi:hypothetical protein
MAEKQKPQKKVVKHAAKRLKNPKTSKIAKSEHARILDDWKNDPEPNRKDVRKKKSRTAKKTVRRVVKKAAPRKAVKRARKRTSRR